MFSTKTRSIRLTRHQIKQMRTFQNLIDKSNKSKIIYDAQRFYSLKPPYSYTTSIVRKDVSSLSTGTKRDLSSSKIRETLYKNVPVVSSKYDNDEIVENSMNLVPATSQNSKEYLLRKIGVLKELQRRKFNLDSRLLTDKESQKGFILKSDKDGESDIENEELHHDRNFITAMRAMKEFLLKPEHLNGLRVTSRRSAKDNNLPLNVYWRKDVEARSCGVWGSLEAMEKEKERREKQALDQQEFVAFYKRHFTKSEERRKLNRKNWPVRHLRPTTESDGLKSESGKVVLWAIGINGGNTLLKFIAWLVTGSHAMFSEVIHSVADTLNQVILAYGIKSSAKKADEAHPYGYTNMQYVSSLISGVGIFCLGAGLSVYHGIDGLINPHGMDSMNVAFAILGMSFISESVTLYLAIKSIKESASFANMGFLEYVFRGYDPCVNVVLLEDTAAVLGVVIAAASMRLSQQYGSHIPDAIGSIIIGGLLGTVATFMITTNSNLLVGPY